MKANSDHTPTAAAATCRPALASRPSRDVSGLGHRGHFEGKAGVGRAARVGMLSIAGRTARDSRVARAGRIGMPSMTGIASIAGRFGKSGRACRACMSGRDGMASRGGDAAKAGLPPPPPSDLRYSPARLCSLGALGPQGAGERGLIHRAASSAPFSSELHVGLLLALSPPRSSFRRSPS